MARGCLEDFVKDLYVEKMVRSTPGTDGEKGSGFGILILKSFMDRFGGKVVIKSDQGKGTQVDLLFKVVAGKSSKRDDLRFGELVMEGLEPKGPY